MYGLLFIFSFTLGLPNYLAITEFSHGQVFDLLNIWQYGFQAIVLGTVAICLEGLAMPLATIRGLGLEGLRYRSLSAFAKAWLPSTIGVVSGTYLFSVTHLPMTGDWMLIALTLIMVVAVGHLAQQYLDECQSVARAVEERRRKGETWIFPWEY